MTDIVLRNKPTEKVFRDVTQLSLVETYISDEAATTSLTAVS
jgi:hypothetical protein